MAKTAPPKMTTTKPSQHAAPAKQPSRTAVVKQMAAMATLAATPKSKKK